MKVMGDEVRVYPMVFEENLHEVVWGGEKLTAWKGLAVRDHIGETSP